ncbi:PBECR2 nuclease fold domain-containing protein [Helicobacter sp. XJK30-2]|uniref:PBECR2 nuclease fold domain-containing protein n=1 Tax=Helicobacter zhangjianzhongii TaxID=2974574 RepID=A0ACC6FUV0_9HELI|nr:PBECR2 nuclease fold domain-containing protein [Helicobacter sp. XJK30-2]MDL0083076.1 PBECR2 nuclease fold domain-containing protein [Helicobacter sp. XJK30-2]
MYCLEKLQRELAYFFDMDLRELPRVQDLLKQKGYTQIQKGDEIIKLEPSTPNQKTPYTDTQGHTHQIPADIAQKWLETFGLKDLQESYTPQFSEQVAQALEPILQGEQITLSANSLVKLIQRDRAEFLPYIKETLETPNAVVRQVDGAIIFAKDYRDEKLGKFFASVSKNDNGEWVISSNAPKNLNNLQNKIKEGGEVLYSDLPELPIIAKPDLTAKALNSEANLSDIIPHTAQEKPKWSKADQKAWKAAKLAETRAKAQELQAKLQPIYDEVRPIIIEAQNIAKTKNLEKNAAAKEKYDELHKKARQIATPKLEQFYPELEKHGLETSLKDFFHHPETAQIQVTPMQNSNLKWKNKERGEQGLKGSAKYREQALEKLSEKSYIDRLEPATKAENPLTQLHGLKYEILKDLHKAKRYAKQGGTSYETYTRYASRASDELDIIEQAIRELKNAIVPKPKRAEQVRSKVQDFIKWRDEVRFDVDYLLGLESDGTRHALEYLRDLPTPTKHHASFVKDLQEQIHKHFDTDPTPPTPPSTPTPADTPKVDSSEIKELSTKTTSKLTKEQLEALPLATPQEYGEFLEKIAQKDYQNAPEILKIATLNNNLQELINNNHSAGVFITRARVGHISEARKSEYGQALTLEEQKQIPEVIAQAKEAYADDKSGFIIPFADKNNGEKINLIILDSDNKGNFLITAKKVNSAELSNPKYKKLARAGVEPATTTPPLKTEQKPTEAISPASDEIIPQPTPQNFIKDFETNNPDIIKTLKNIQSFEPLYHYKESMKLLESYASQIIATEHPLIKGYLKELELQFTNYIQALANQRITGGFLGTHTYSQAQAHTNTTQKYSQALKNMDDLIKAARKKDYIFNTLNASDNALVFTTATSTGEPRVAIRLTSQDYKLQKSLKKLKISYNPNYNQYQTTIENYHARKEAIQDLLDLQLPEISKAEQDNIKQQAKAHSKALHKTNPFEQAIGDNVEKTAKTAPASDSTKGVDLSLNSSEIMPPTTQTPTTQKGLFDEADSSATTPPQKEPTQKGKTDFNMLVLESWSKDNEYLRDILDFIKANPLAQKIDSQLTEKWGYDSDVPPLVVFDSALLLKDKEAFLQTKDPLTPKQMQRFREKAERHFAVAQKYGLDLDGFYDFAREWRKVVNNYQNYGHTNRKKIETSLDSSTPTPQATPKADSTPKALTPQEATKLLESKQGARLPQELDIQSFLKSLESVENKENFIAHLQKKGDAQSRLAYLHIVEPTLKHPDIELTKGERKTKIKVFNDGENFYSFLIADFQDKRLFTFLPKARKGYIESKIKNADLIHTFTSQASKDQEPNGLARESIAQDLQDTPKVDSNALLKSAMKKFAYDEKKAKDLLEWHKDSSPLTKDENGLPKVFYHGTSSDKVFEVFNKDKIHSGYGFWFGDDIADRAVKENTTGKAPIIKAFLQMKKPFIFSNQGITAQNIDEYAYITGISKKRITELYEAKEAFNTLEKMIQRDTQADYVWAGAVDYFEIEKGGKELNIFDYRQLDLSDQTIAFLDRMRTKGITARGIDISPTRQYESAQEARETLERLKEKGYDSMVYANSEFVVFDSNQIKHIENRGVESESGRKYFNDSSPNIFHSNPHLGAGLLGGSVAGVEQDENGQWRFSPEKFALGLLGSTAGSKAVSSGKYAIMRRMEAKKQDKRLYNVFKAIDSSAKYGSKMNLIGKENLNAETLAYALARNKRFAINKLDEKVAKELGFKYPQDVRRSIDPNNVAHTLNRHGEQSNLVKFSGQKPVTLDEIAKYQDYADNATHKGISIGKRQETASISARQLDGEFYVVVEQIQKGRNELGFKTMYFERGILDDEKFNKLLKK